MFIALPITALRSGHGASNFPRQYWRRFPGLIPIPFDRSKRAPLEGNSSQDSTHCLNSCSIFNHFSYHSPRNPGFIHDASCYLKLFFCVFLDDLSLFLLFRRKSGIFVVKSRVKSCVFGFFFKLDQGKGRRYWRERDVRCMVVDGWADAEE